MNENTLLHAYNQVLSRIEAAAKQFQREPSELTLLGVSKKQPHVKIQYAYDAGLRHFGENQLQEAIPKILHYRHLDIHWHFIGSIQSNKTQEIAQHFSWVQSIDRIKIAQRLNQQRPISLPPLNVCIQVNISMEPQKSGVLPNELPQLLDAVSNMPRLQLRGLMCLPKSSSDFNSQRQPFHAMHQLYQQYEAAYGLDSLSMGMSNDLEAAIAEGTTLLRIGQAIFGSRP